MKISHGVGTRLPVWATSMGPVLLGNCSDAVLDDYFEQITPVALTDYTVTDKRKLKCIVQDTKKQGWSTVNQNSNRGRCTDHRNTAYPKLARCLSGHTHPATGAG